MSATRLRFVSRGEALRVGGIAAALAFAAPSASIARGTRTQLLDQWAQGWSNLSDPAKLLALVTTDVVYEDVAAGDVERGADAFRALLAVAAKAMPNFHIELFDGFTTDTMAAAEYAITGTQSGDLPYLKATGKSFRLRAASVFVLDGGKIKRESRYYDMASFLEQVGVLSPKELPALGTPALKPGGGS